MGCNEKRQGMTLVVPIRTSKEFGLQPLKKLLMRHQFAILISASFLIAPRSFSDFTINRTPVPSA